MKQLITILFCLFTLFAEAQVNPNDTTKYFKSYDYGFSYRRLQAREAFIMPTDTVINKLGAVSLNGAIYLGNGIKWTSIGSGGSSTDTTSLSNRINQRIDSLRRSSDSIFARKNGVFVFQYKDSTGTIPTLQQVTNAGATTTNAITVPSLNLVTNSQSLNINRGNDGSFIVTGTNNPDFFKVNDGPPAYLQFGSVVGYHVKFIANGNSDVELTAPNLTGRIPLSVNGNTADNNGNITISTGAVAVDTIFRTLGKDSIFYKKNNITYAIKDSVGGASNDTAKVVIAQVHNATATTLLKGEVVYLFGSNGNVASVKRANNKQDSTSSKTFGLVRRDIPAGQNGFITTQGQIEKLNLGAYNEGDVLWLDSLDGQFTKVKPQAPYHGVFLGVVERANNGNGLAYVKPQNGVELDEIHDVQITTPTNNQVLVYSDTQSIWKNRNIYSVVDTASTIATKTNLNSYVNLTTAQTIAGTKTFSSNIKIPGGSQLILQVNSDGTVNGMTTTIYPSPTELTYVKGVTSGIQGQINNKVNISDTATMLSPYAKNNLVATKLNATDTASLSNRIDNEVSNLDILQAISFGIKAEPYGVTLKDISGQLTTTTGRLYLYPFNWNVSDSIRGVGWFNRTTLTITANNYNGVAIYSLSGGTLTRLTFTANNSTFWDGSINTWITRSIAPFFLNKGVYFLGFQVSSSGTVPTIGCTNAFVTGLIEPPSAVNPNGIKINSFVINSTTSPPSSIAMSTATATTTAIPYFFFY